MGGDLGLPESLPGMNRTMDPSHANFAGLRVAAFESRRAAEMGQLIEKFGGMSSVSPSMREVPNQESTDLVDFAHRLMSAQIDVVLLLTGVGTRQLISHLERHVDVKRFLACLADVITIARGPKPVAALRELGIEPTYKVPEPNTWREILRTIDQNLNVVNQTVALQEYGIPNFSLVAGLEARGAIVRCLKVYQWDLPEDRGPLLENLRAIAAGEMDVAMFTSGHQAVNLLRLGESQGLGAELRRQLSNMVVASIGPTTTETLAECGIGVDLEPDHPKMGHLVRCAAERAAELLRHKRDGSAVDHAPRIRPPDIQPWEANLHENAAAAAQKAWHQSPFLRACRLEPNSVTPIWLMRQAGRYMPEYRAVRQQTSFLDLCRNPRLCAEVMLHAVQQLGVDAAILFADLLPMLQPMGIDLEFSAGEGPVIHNPVREPLDVDRVRELDELEALDFVFEAVRLTRAGLPDALPLIGFAGAPFTLASYVIEGGASRNFVHTRRLMFRDEGAWNELLSRLARGVARYLRAQIDSGAQAVQLFDSWVGCLGPDDYRRYVLPHTRSIVEALPRDVPLVNFATGNPALLPLLAEAGGAVIGADWRVRLEDAWRTVGYDKAIQGNLDPLVLLSDPAEIRRRAKEILDQAAGRPGHIFNLGHGVLPETPVENVRALVDAVHELSQRG